MFAGNAKTHFQIIGKNNNSDGYMMSPFGDERWDVDDKEKLRKIYKKPEEGNVSCQNYERGCYSQHQLPSAGNINAAAPNYQTMREPNWGYNQQSELSSQNYAPNYKNYAAYQVQTPQTYYPEQTNPAVHYQQVGQTPQGAWSSPVVQPSLSNAVPVAKRNNGLNYEEVKQKPKTIYYQPNHMKNETQSVQGAHSLQGVQSVQAVQSSPVCDQCCCHYGSNKNSNQILEKNWKLSSHVPILIAGETAYKPLGPIEATPNPFYPTREKTIYAPL